jgi:hypothetical protein
MPHRTVSRRARVCASIASAAALTCALSAQAALPLIAGLGKQLLKDMLIDGVKSQLIGTLAGSGCKGAATASLLASAGNPRAAVGGALGMPSGMPIMGAGAMPSMPGGAGAVDPAMLQQMIGARAGSMPNMPTMPPEQAAQMAAALQSMQQAMAQPLSRAETIAVFDELAELGVMTPAMRTEARDCITLAPPGANVGMAGAMLKTMLLPPLRSAREQMHALSPEDRVRLAVEIVDGLQQASAEDRKAFQDGFGLGFFPPDVAERVKARLR